jgi:hypothetical protein
LNASTADQPFFFSTSTMASGRDTSGQEPNPASGGVTAGDELVQRARREIADIIREVAALARKPIDRKQFFSTLLDRTVSAIAAEGAIIWDCRPAVPIAIARTGRITDASIDPEAVGTHDCLLREIAALQTPAVVPATPGATDAGLPSNPTEHPAALVPILDLSPGYENTAGETTDEGSLRYVLEVFLESEAGVATQRGYLRFIAQMSDIASSFLQADEIRLSRTRESMRSQLMRALDRLHRLETSTAVAAEIVDSTADMFGVARVSLAMVRPGRPRLIAVSHVDAVDHRGETCRRLLKEINAIQFSNDQCIASDFGSPVNQDLGGSDELGLQPYAATRNAEDRVRMLLQHLDQQQGPNDCQVSYLDDWSRQAMAILSCRLQFESIPLAKAYLAISPEFFAVSPTRGRRLITIMGGLIALGMIAMIPTQMLVTMPATLRPEGARTHYAPSDSIVEQVEVQHGQHVQSGDVLVRLRDWALEEQMTTLVARRAVISQRLSRSIASLVDVPRASSFPAPSHASTTDEELVQEQRLLEEELTGLSEQIDLVEAARGRLVIRADRAGRVDAWQTELTATGRPVRRGDLLVRVEPDGMRWMADARIDQSRVSAVLDQFREDANTIVKVATVARPELCYTARFLRRELAIAPTTASGNAAANSREGSLGIELAIELDHLSQSRVMQDESWTSGAPASVAIDCGKRPLVQVMFFDLVRAVRQTWVRWV